MINYVYVKYFEPFCIFGSVQSNYSFQREDNFQQYIKSGWKYIDSHNKVYISYERLLTEGQIMWQASLRLEGTGYLFGTYLMMYYKEKIIT